jgi:hypothetical protein
MKILITLSSAGNNTGPFNIYSNIDNYTTAFATGISKDILLAGYITNDAPMGTTYVRVQSVTTCKNYVDMYVSSSITTTTTTTNPTPTTTTTTTITPTTSTTTTPPPTTTTTTTLEPLPGVGIDFVYTLI